MKNIIVVDMQKGFIKDTNKHLINKINKYLKNNKFDNIFFTQCINNENSPYTKLLKWNGVKVKEDQEIIVDIPEHSKILVKNCYSLKQEDINMFKSLGITEMEICGTDTDACCLAISFNLFDNNIKPIILSNLCASSSMNENAHKNALELMKRQFSCDNIKTI